MRVLLHRSILIDCLCVVDGVVCVNLAGYSSRLSVGRMSTDDRHESPDCALLTPTLVLYHEAWTRTRLSDRSFATEGPRIWNSFPTELRLVDSYNYYTSLRASVPGTTWVNRYQKDKTSLDLNEARDDGVLGWQWHQLDHMQTVCTSLQTDNHTDTSSVNFYTPGALPDAQPTVSNH